MSVILDGPLTSLAFCWLLERKDGAGLALTSHDEAVVAGGVRYEPAPGMTPASIRSSLGIEPQASEVAGSLSATAISEVDVFAGRWDGAALALRAVDWTVPEAEAVELVAGELGSITRRDEAFETELKGAAARLEAPVCPHTSPQCRARLGDKACRVDMAGRSVRAAVVSVAGTEVTLDQAVGPEFQFGQLRVLRGKASGERRTILGVSGPVVTMQMALAGMPVTGDLVELTEGCDRTLATCSGRFGNAANFRGEPHLPGNDLLTRYPGA